MQHASPKKSRRKWSPQPHQQPTQRTSAPTFLAAADPSAEAVANPLDNLTASPLVSDSEIIILQLKPSILYILLSSLGSLFAIAFGVLLLAYLAIAKLPITIPYAPSDVALFGIIITALRLAWQTLDWGGRTFILTDRRIIVATGVFRRKHFQASLFHIQHIAVIQSFRERIFKLGTIAFATAGSATYDTAWHTIPTPFKHHQTIVDAVDRFGGHHPSS